MSDSKRLREALAKIAKIAGAASGAEGVDDTYEQNGGEPHEHADYDYGCTLRNLPNELLEEAARNAVEINPVNAPVFGPLGAVAAASDAISDPLSIAVLTGKYWGPSPRRLSVSFMESTPSDLRARIVLHLNAWSRTAGVSFVQTQGVGEVRISRGGGGYYSYLGTDIRLIPQNRQTMNLQGFTMNTPDSEFTRVIRHEAGHTLGFPHEHMRSELVARIDREKAYDYFFRTQGWNRQMVDQQVLTPLNNATIFGTPADQDSIMCYQLPGSITRDGQPIRGGRDINQSDFNFAGRIYPRLGFAPFTQGSSSGRRSPSEQQYSQEQGQAGEFEVSPNFDFEYTA